MSKTFKRVCWFVVVIVLSIGLAISAYNIDQLEKENEDLLYTNEQLQDLNIHLTDRNWNLQFQLQNKKDSSL